MPRPPVSRAPRAPGRGAVLAWLLALVPAVAAPAQDPQDRQGPVPVQQGDEGKVVRGIRFEGLRSISYETVLQFLETKTGEELSGAKVRADSQRLWDQLRILVLETRLRDAEEGGVIVVFVVDEPDSFDRVVFKGLDAFSEPQVRSLLELTPTRRITDIDAEERKRLLEQRYWADGYYWTRVQLQPDEETSTLVFAIDEGPRVRVRNVRFVGNRAFPGRAPFNLYQNLISGAELENAPGVFQGDPYSDEALADDLDRLRRYYRSHGYRDAEIELAERSITEDGTRVDLTFRVVEGPRYMIRSVDVVRYEDGEVDPDPLYDKEEILEVLEARAGAYYDREIISRDKQAIELFYGERGHPLQGRFNDARSQAIPGAFEWLGSPYLQPRETFHPDTAEIDLVYEVVEGTPKTVRDIKIRGNTHTKDRVVRRELRVLPGERLDVREVQRSLRRLDSLRYFQDPDTLAGAEFELIPVPDEPELVDLEVEVHEGDTGSFVWGAGVSTDLGIQGRFNFTKRNFDLFRLPSSPNPVTVVSEVISNEAFHGGGQELEVRLAPGTQLSSFLVSFDEPDLFGDHFDPIGLKVQGFRTLRRWPTFRSDGLGGIVQLSHFFSDELRGAVEFRQETIEVEDIDFNAPRIVFEDAGQSELRSLRLVLGYRDVDFVLRPTEGHDLLAIGEVAGGPLGGNESFWKLALAGKLYVPLYRDTLGRAHVLHLSQTFDLAQGFGDSEELFVTERFYMGGGNLRGFDRWGAGPTVFGEPLGGEARALSTVEYQFPLVSHRPEGAFFETELLRGVLFADGGLLGTSIDDPTFGEARLSVGFGVRIHVPVLGLPIALDFGFPVVYEETDDRQLLYFSLSRR